MVRAATRPGPEAALFRLKSYEFRRERRGTWAELERLVVLAERRGVRALAPDQLARLPVLYSATVSSLSVARAISLDRNLLDYLENLCARAYLCVYGAKQGLVESILDFFGRRFPASVRRFRWHVALAGFFFLLGGVTAFALVDRSPEWYYTFVDEGMAAGRDPSASTETLRDGLYGGGGDGELGLFASYLFQHNARVGMLSFALGFLAGIPVYLLLFKNGLVLGAFAALHHGRGLGFEMWGWLLPHGVTELLAIVLCGGAGLVLAQALVFPGRHGRLANLARRGREAGVVVLGCVAMLLVAALLEGFFRQLVHATSVRWAVAVSTAAFWLFYFTRVGRRRA